MNSISEFHAVLNKGNVLALALFNPVERDHYEAALEAIRELVNEKNKNMEQPMKRLNGIVSHLNSGIVVNDNSKLILSYKARLESLMRDHFPFKAVSPGIVKEVLSIPANDRFYTTATILQKMFLERAQKNELIIDGSASSRQLQILIEMLDARVLGRVLEHFKDKATGKADSLSCYIFCFLLKAYLQVNTPLPKKEEYSKDVMFSFVRKVMEDIDYDKYPLPVKLMELTIYRSDRLHGSLLLSLLTHECKRGFLEFITNYLHGNDSWWDNKDNFFISLLEILTKEARIILSQALSHSVCKKTALIFSSVLQGLTNTTPEGILHLNLLKEMMPNLNLNKFDFEIIFGIPLMPLDSEHSKSLKDIPAVRRLSFNVKDKFLIDNDTIIGKHRSNIRDFLLAFDLCKGTMQWAYPLPERPNPVSYQLTCHGIAILEKNIDRSKMYFIDPKTGLTKYTLPHTLSHNYSFSDFHITPQGFFYYMSYTKVGKLILGCTIKDGQEKTVFIKDTPRGRFMPLGEFVYFPDDLDRHAVIYSKTGKKYKLECSVIQYANNKIYTIQRNGENNPVFTSYQLCDDEFVLKNPQEVNLVGVIKDWINLDLDICEDETCIITTSYRVYFVEPKIGVLREISINPTVKCFIDKKRSMLWTFNASLRELRKHTKKSSTVVGDLETSDSPAFLHVDHDGRLCFVD